MFVDKLHPFAAAYRGVDRVKLFDKIFSLHFPQLCQQEEQASIHSQAIESAFFGQN